MRQNLLQSATCITKFDKRLLESVTGVTKCETSRPTCSFSALPFNNLGIVYMHYLTAG